MSDFSIRDMKADKDLLGLERDKITRLGMNVYDTHVDGIPDGRIEMLLWEYGHCMVWKHPIAGWIATPAEAVGWDYDGVPNRWRAYYLKPMPGWGTPPEMTEEGDCVMFHDCLHPGMMRSRVLMMCEQFNDVRSTIETQVFNQKTPLLAVCGNSKTKAKLKNAIIQIGRNAKALFIDADLKDSITQLDMNPVYNVESLWKYSRAIENEMLEAIGIDSQDAYMKKERLVVDEQEGNDELLNYLLADGLKARRIACDKLREKGVTCSSEIQELVRPIADEEVVDDRETEQI